MILKFDTNLEELASCLPLFLKLANSKRLKKRAIQLSSDAVRSPFQAKIVEDYHWLELALSKQMIIYEMHGCLIPEQIDIESLTALYFAQTVVEVHHQLPTSGRIVLEGRIQDALNVEAGFAPLYLEMSMSRTLFEAGYYVDFYDMEGSARYDLRFWKGAVGGEVECKSQSCDAGRKIHRKDFYRFMESIGKMVETRALSGKNEIIIVTLKDRLPTNNEKQSELREAVKLFFLDPKITLLERDFFKVTRDDFDKVLGNVQASNEHEFYNACENIFGHHCHLSGLKAQDGVCLLVMRSQGEDDTSKPIIEAMEKAATQFSGTQPAFVALQFDDILPSDLLLPHLRQRVGILSYSLFHNASHIISTRFSAYRGLVASNSGIGEPAFAIINPKPRFRIVSANYSPFLGGISDKEYARLLGKFPPS